MRSPARLSAVVAITFTLLVGSGCSVLPSKSSASPSAARSPATSPSRLGAQVPLPAGFPTDFPVYPGARLTQAANFGTNGSADWGMEWQTLAGPSKVQAFFVHALGARDWIILTYSGKVNTAFAATFKRRSTSKVTGTIGVAVSARTTKISLVLSIAQ